MITIAIIMATLAVWLNVYGMHLTSEARLSRARDGAGEEEDETAIPFTVAFIWSFLGAIRDHGGSLGTVSVVGVVIALLIMTPGVMAAVIVIAVVTSIVGLVASAVLKKSELGSLRVLLIEATVVATMLAMW